MPAPRVLLFLVACLWSVSAFAASPYLVADLNEQPDTALSSFPYYLTRSALNGAALFVASGTKSEMALWRTDGTSAGTQVLIPLAQSDVLDVIASSLRVGNTLYLGVHQPDGYRIWKTDGTAAGTVALTGPRNDALYVAGVSPRGLLVLDAGLRDLKLLQGTELVTLATIRTTRSQGTSLAHLGDDVYIGTENGLWKSDGTAAGTTKIATVPVTRLVAAGNRLFFAGRSATFGGELWTSDGTTSGTQLVADLVPGAESLFGTYSAMTAFGGGVLLIGGRGEIVTSDGTAGNTRILLTGAPPKASQSFAIVGSTIFFPFDDGQHGRELWRSDGTTAGTRLVRDASDGDSSFSMLAAGATRIYYYSSDREKRFELFESDGSEEGTRAVPPRTPDWRGSGISWQTLTTHGDTVFFAAETRLEGNEPWIRDAGGLRLLANIAAEASGSSHPVGFFAGRSHVFFSAMGRFWRTNGTEAGTEQLPPNAGGTALAAVGDTLYFSRPRASLWRTDETVGAVMIENFDPGYNIPVVRDVTEIGGRIYVRADAGSGVNLYVTDGTAGGVSELHDEPLPPADLAGQAYFLDGREGILYTTSGTRESTRTVTRTDDRFTSTWANLIPFNGELYLFGEHQLDDESVLWKFSGTAGHAEVVKRFPDASYIKHPLAAATPKELFFTWQARSRPNQLWKTDGTAEGTVMVREFAQGTFGTTLTDLVSLGERVVFVVDDGVHGIEPWVTDGTAAGTILLRDIHPTGSSDAGSLVVADGVVYFAATDPEHGSELWQTDGTPEGTRLVADVLPGVQGSRATPAIAWRDRLFFPATTLETGRELWALPLIDAAIVIDDVRVRESAGSAQVAVRLTRASNRTVTVAWTTSDAAAKAGRDYTSASGTLTFAPGQTLQTVTVPLLDDEAPGAVRAFTVRLADANVPIQDAAGAVIVEDDDVRTDLLLSFVPTAYLPLLRVTNAGPSAASNVQLCWALLPGGDSVRCSERRELAPGASFTTQFNATGFGDTIIARVSQWEPDTNPSNNTKTWLTAGESSSSMHVEPATPRVGQTGTIFIVQYSVPTATTVTLTSSDPTVISVPATVVIAAGETTATTTFTALRAGSATITAKTHFRTPAATVRVYSPGETLRAIPIVTLTGTDSWRFGVANVLTARVNGIATTDARPSGTIAFYEGTRLLGNVPLVNGVAEQVVTTPTPGLGAYTAVYSGDANFGERRSNVMQRTVAPAQPSIRAAAGDDAGTAMVIVTGTAGQPPSGTLTVVEQGVSRQATLVPQSFESSSAVVLGLSPEVRMITVTYAGDAYYAARTVTVPVEYGRQRAVRH